jgi:hypothetical protein
MPSDLPQILGQTFMSSGWYNMNTGESYTTTTNPNSPEWERKNSQFNNEPCSYCGCKTRIEDVHCCACGAPVE